MAEDSGDEPTSFSLDQTSYLKKELPNQVGVESRTK